MMSDISMQVDQVNSIVGGSSKYQDRPDVKKAREDFRYVSSSSEFVVSNYLDYLRLSKNSVPMADFLVIPFDTQAKITRFPKSTISAASPKLYVAVVCYANGNPIDVLLFNSALLGKKPFKFDGKTGEFVLKIKDVKNKKIQNNSFGVMVTKL